MLASLDAPVFSFAIGPKAGVNLSGVNAGEVSTERRFGFAIGATIDFRATEPLGVTIEPLFVQRGANLTNSGTLELGYLEIPVLFKAKLGMPDLHFYGVMGLNPAINLSVSGQFNGVSVSRDDLRNWDLGMDLGAGGAYRTSPTVWISSELRYTHGFMNVVTGSAGPLQEWRTRDFKFLTGVTFQIFE